MDQWLGHDGKLMQLLDKAGQLILLNLIWVFCCILVLPAGGVTVALYYAVIKSIRRDQGDAFQEFFQCFKANFLRGLGAFLILAVTGTLLYVNWQILQQGQGYGVLKSATLAVAVMALFAAVYIFPVLSRFRMNLLKAFALAFTMSIRYLHFTVVFVLGTAALVVLQVYVLPMVTVIILPSAWCFATTYLMEKALRHYMPPREESDSAWYYE